MNDRPGPDKESVAKRPAAPGVGTPFAGESSSSNVPVPLQDRAQYDPDATVVDAGQQFDSEATLVDVDATIAPGTSVRRTPTRSPSSWTSAVQGSAAV